MRAPSHALTLTLALLAPLAGACKKSPEPAKAPACATCVSATEHGFVPSHLDLAKGAPGAKVALTFTRETDDTCALDVVFPELEIKKPLPLKVPVTVELPVDEARTLTFQCGMAMYKSSVVVR
jgi:plastocyanin domain-containing protein